jgi:hypothetical protein
VVTIVIACKTLLIIDVPETNLCIGIVNCGSGEHDGPSIYKKIISFIPDLHAYLQKTKRIQIHSNKFDSLYCIL